jgi:hypothetical protein
LIITIICFELHFDATSDLCCTDVSMREQYTLLFWLLRKHDTINSVNESSGLDFNSAGDKLASVSQSPDYMLTVWNWCDEAISLRYAMMIYT